jgi:PLP dependent protein
VQTNKAKALVHGVPNLTCVETVDSIKLADKLNVAVETCEMRQKRLKVLNVMVQVNTSGEESKYGVTPGDSVIDLAKHIAENCKQENFECLRNERAKVALALGYKDENELELSMGMSGDFESAIAMGSTNVRVGSTIFGARDYNK